MGHTATGVPFTSAIYVCNLPPGTDEMLLAEHFGTIGLLKKDKRTGRPKIWIYRDKVTNEPKGDATVTYEDPHAAAAAVEWFNNTDFHGRTIGVFIAQSKYKEPVAEATADTVPEQVAFAVDSQTAGDLEMEGAIGAGGNIDDSWGGPGGRGRGRGEPGGKAWQQEGDWLCPNPSCSNINFAFRGVCNRCGTARPAGSASAGGGGMGGGRGRGRRGSVEPTDRGRGPGGPPGLFGPNDWTCPMCGNINWAKRIKCNICNTTKPGHNEGGVREGRAGGYKEYDEAEIEETKRRRREMEEDDGEMYDEFGNLKKKFRVKAKQGDLCQNQQTAPGTGKAGWDKDDLGVIERDMVKEKNRVRGSDYNWDKIRDRDGHMGVGSFRDGEYGNEYDKDGGQDRGRGKDRDRYDHKKERYSERDRDNYRDERSRDRDHEWERDKGRGRDRERERERERDRDFDHDRDRDWPRERDRARDRERFLD